MNLTPLQSDALTELMNVASGRAAAALAAMLDQRVEMRVVETFLLDRASVRAFLERELGTVGTAVIQGYTNGMTGHAALLLSHEDAGLLVRALLRSPRDLANLSIAEQSALSEVGNVVLNACVAILADQLEVRVKYQLPRLLLNIPGAKLAHMLTDPWKENTRGLLFASQMTVRQIKIRAHIMLVFVLRDESIRKLLASLLGD